ncbi:5-formyltetrahydrofolate cyclo-ligase [Anaerocolumna sp. MB42-C2]|uniref:5-formyltetrahydrofolate cyclo-ligase n=1 Tax=Anaerocolumna sp. MB42-C2 TaxID=3070997 RepID=UPI0027DF43DA|nr:5-formyltetrahydrofolate cyclo-ligase [Anaerocolumna sp. MB42-C2]WMJ88071.1 5-formyltetrahydrofolate cyclo-ligase [Anaerocolumna sp. MB42-C2]
MEKNEIRKSIKELKKHLPESDRVVYSERILEQLYEISEFKKCKRIFCYVSFNQEVITTSLITTALKQGKKTAVPKVTQEGLKFFYINSLKDLTPGVLGILEPTTIEEAIPDPLDENLIIVPGLAFDEYKNRIGYGKGYYDSFFRQYASCPLKKIALAYDFQVQKKIPVEESDIKVDSIITQYGIIK